MPSNTLNQYQYLFVGGILGELLALPFVASYFRETEELLRTRGAQHVAIYQPHSFRSAEDNAQSLLGEIERLYRLNGKQIVLFCHSKACIEAVLALISRPGIFEKMVQRVFCVQPPFRGTSITTQRAVSRVYSASSKVWPAIRCLRKNAYTSRFERLARTRPDLSRLVEEKVVTVKGAKSEAGRVAWVLKFSYHLLSESGEATDGLLALSDQDMPGFKVRSVTLPMDHSDLFTSKLISNEGPAFKVRALEQLLSLA